MPRTSRYLQTLYNSLNRLEDSRAAGDLPSLRAHVPHGDCRCGGVIGYPLEQAYREVAFIAYHFHWPHDAIMSLEHRERKRWVAEISEINVRVNGNQA